MRIDEARSNIGSIVTYHPAHNHGNHSDTGIIRAVGKEYVFVQWEGEITAIATIPANVTLSNSHEQICCICGRAKDNRIHTTLAEFAHEFIGE